MISCATTSSIAREREQAEVEELYRELWDPFDDPWWREPAPFARPSDLESIIFLPMSWQRKVARKSQCASSTPSIGLSRFPRANREFQGVEDELRVLGEYSPSYETLEGHLEEDVDLYWLGRKLAAWQVTTAYPIAMQISGSRLDGDEKRTLYRLIYSYIIRRALSGLTAKNLNRVFQGISQTFLQDGPSRDTMENYFAERTGDSTRFPSDTEFRQGIVSKPAYTLAPQSRIKDVLWELEEASRSRFAESISMPPSLWTEHVLPISWTEEWPFEDGEFVEVWSNDPKTERRNRVLHTLGNLTLLTDALNISSGNKGFLEKREKLEEHTGLFLNKWFLKKNSWHETHIRERSEALVSRS